jgi:aminoglycoside phosphotransferase (APT) family kinase protein
MTCREHGQMHPGMHLIDDDLVRRLIAGQFPQWAGLAVERWPSGGTVNAMYRLGGDMVVRLPLVQGAGAASPGLGWAAGVAACRSDAGQLAD